MIRQLHARALHIPFKQSFKHASAERSTSQSVWVEVESQTGARGFGEGCPREYVTGESITSALTFIRDIEPRVARLGNIHEMRTWVDAQRAAVDANPAAWCAVELALLDVMAREEGRTVESLLGLSPIAGPFHYSAVLGAEEPTIFQGQLERYRKMGFRDYKAKLSGEPELDRARMVQLKAASGAIASLRLDANNLWKNPKAALEYLRGLDAPFFAVEEPLGPARYADLEQLAASAGIQIVLDESFLQIEQFDELRARPGPWIINLRVSKLGGMLRSIAVMERARAENIPLIIGCQVGETSLLTRAALTIAQAATGKGLLAQEGALGTHLLQHDVVKRPLMFGAGGTLDVTGYNFDQAAGFGFGLGDISIPATSQTV